MYINRTFPTNILTAKIGRILNFKNIFSVFARNERVCWLWYVGLKMILARICDRGKGVLGTQKKQSIEGVNGSVFGSKSSSIRERNG